MNTPPEIGTKVHYIGFEGSTPENGIVKSRHSIKSNIVYVVYKCNNEWDRFKDFTGESTLISDLYEGWK